VTGVGAGVADLTGRRLLARVARAQADGRLPSVVAGVVRDGEPAWFGTYGGPAVDGHDPLDVQYRVGSITKTMTAVLVLQDVGDGRVALDDPVSAVLGDLGGHPFAGLTLRTLLAHDSGMQSEPTGSWWERSAGVSFDELLSRNGGGRPPFGAHERFHYSNLGFALLGEVAARLAGGSWWEAVEQRVLRPLGMSRTSYLPTGAAAQGWSVHPYDGTLVAEPATDTAAMAPAGQVWATIRDLATYAVFLGSGHPVVLSAEELRTAFAPQSGSADDGLGYAHGLGFQLFPGGSGTLAGHSGSMPGFLAACLVDVPRRTGAVVLTNATAGSSPVALAVGLLEELEHCEPTLPTPWRPSPPVPAELAGVPGVWHWGNTPFVFAMEGDELVARRNGEVTYRFAVTGDGRVVGRFGYHAGEELHAVRRPDGTVGHLEIATFVYTRTPYDPDAPIPGGHPAH
jgi:D-alanyl-D-alanine carboxypeptidase